MADKITTNFEAARVLMFAAQDETRSQKTAKKIAAACAALQLSAADRFRIFAALEYADKNTGAAYPFGAGSGRTRRTIPGEVLWDFAAYQADMKAKGR